MPEIGQKLSHFKIVEKIGEGGMGTVFLAEDLTLDRKVALKFLPDAFTSDPERMARFEREAKLLASLNHPNIAGIYGLEQADGNRFLVLEYVEGETLQACLSKGALPLEEALELCRQIAEGLEAAHEKGVIHRDLKPANVMITAEEKVKILDFGLAKAFSDDTQSIDSSQSPTLTEAMTRPGVILGTAAYMSPEQAKGKSVDKRADIWAFGCILYECLTGRRAFEGETVTETLAAILRGEPDWQTLPETTTQNIRFVLQKCLEKEKGRRFQSAADVRILIDETPYTVEVTKSEKHPFPWIAWSIAAAFIVAFAILFFIHLGAKPSSQFKPVQIQMGIPPNFLNLPFSLSPNGKYLAFPALMGASMYLEIRPLNSIETNLLLNTESVSFMSHLWSPDSRFIVFDAGGKLKKIDVSEGQSKFVCDLEGYANGGSWNQNDLIIFGDTGAKGLMQVHSSGGTALPLTRTNPERMEIRHSSPIFLPDGNHFLYVCESDSNEYSGIYIGKLDSDPDNQKSTQLVVSATTPCYVPSQDSDLGQLLFLQDLALKRQLFDENGLKLVGEPLTIAEDIDNFSVSANGILIYKNIRSVGSEVFREELVWMDREGKKVGSATPPGDWNDFRLSRDGKKIAFDRVHNNLTRDFSGSDIYVRDLVTGKEDRLTFNPEDDNLPIWSPDGLHVLFPSNRTGSFNLYLKASSGVGQEKVLVKLGTQTGWGTDWSDDGHFIIFQIPGDKTGQDLWIAPQSEEKEPYPYLNTEFNEQDGRFSPNGKWIAYSSNESGHSEIYVRAFPDADGGTWQISTGGGTEPYWNENGTELFYIASDRNLMSVPVKLDPIFEKKDQPQRIMFIPESAGRNSYAVSDNGNKFLVANRVGELAMQPITILVNWQSDLKQ